MAVGASSPKFVGIGCINIVVAANAGGHLAHLAILLRLLVWQKGIVDFQPFFYLFVLSVVNFVIPASNMHFAIPNETPHSTTENVELRRGAIFIAVLLIATIAAVVSFYNFLHLPPVVGMMTGLAHLQIFGYYLKKTHVVKENKPKYEQPSTTCRSCSPFSVCNPKCHWGNGY